MLAIVTVCAFGVVLFDQIAERLSFEKAQAATDPAAIATDAAAPALDVVAAALTRFRAPPATDQTQGVRESEVVGSVAGYLSKFLPDASLSTDARLVGDRAFEVDISLTQEAEQILIEIKQGKPGAIQVRNGIGQLSHYMALSGAKQGVLFFYSSEEEPNYDLEEHRLPGLNGRIVIISSRRLSLPR